MRALIYALALNKVGGGSRTLCNLLRHAGTIAPNDFFRVLTASPAIVQTEMAGAVPPNVEIISCPRENAFGRVWADNVTLPRAARACDADVIYSPFVYSSLRPPVPQVVAQSNALQYSHYYETRCSPWEAAKLRVRRLLAYRTMLASKAVVVNTRATQRLIQECFPNLGNEKFVLIPHPDDSDDYANGKRFSSVGQDSAAEALPVVLYISHFAPYKGHLELIRAMRAVFADGIRFNLLVTVAEGDWPAGYEPLMREIVLAGLRRYVVNLGRISQRDAIAAYGRASVFVFPSYVESFGLPLRDALANALPIVAADTEVNREIAGGGALYYPVGDTSALAAHLSHLLTNSSTKERLSTQGKLHYASTRTTKSDNAAAVFSLLRSLC